MPRPLGPQTRILSLEDRGGSGAGRYRVRYLLEGRKLAEGFATAREAADFVSEFNRLHEGETGPTVGELIDRWIEDRESQGLFIGVKKGRYYETNVRGCLIAVLDEPAAVLDGPAIADGFKAFCEGKSGASSKLYRSCLRSFGGWLVDAKHCRTNPADGLKVRGVVNAGKPQIESLRETMAFDAEAVRRARLGCRGALACLLGLHLGLRKGEVLALEPRHIDIDRVIRVPGTKTAASKRALSVPSDELWGLVEKAAKEGGRLVPYTGTATLPRKVREIARAAGVANADELCFHSLRGMAASLATRAGAPSEAIAATLGHTSYAVTGAHYATKESQVAAEQERRFTVLKGGRG
jgi:site-specific recombinase XerC